MFALISWQIDRDASIKYFLEKNTMFQNKTTYAFEPYGEDKVYVIYTKMFISSLLYNRYIIPCEDILLKNSWQRCCWRCQAFLSAAVLCTCIFCRLVYTTTVLDKACMWQLCSNVQVTIGTCLHDNFYERWGHIMCIEPLWEKNHHFL